jgi:hypothetical protein
LGRRNKTHGALTMTLKQQLIESRIIDVAVKYRFHKESVNSRANSLFRLVVFGEALS